MDRRVWLTVNLTVIGSSAYSHRRKPQPLLCLAGRGRGNIGSFLRNTGQVLSGGFQEGDNQRSHRQMSSSRYDNVNNGTS